MLNYRKEKDLLGENNVPENVYWGIHTQRALENFPISGIKTNRKLIDALCIVKKACVTTNLELGYLEDIKARAIMAACDEIMEGKFNDQFPLDAFQGGAGTSTNMNVNEVIANRALELMNKEKGSYELVNPIEDVNMHQSTNDVYPTALKVACIRGFRALSEEAAKLQGAFQKKEKEFAGVVKIGRTEMQEAVPITLGAEFSAFAEAIARDRWRTFKCEERLRTVNIGGTAVGTGLAAPRSYIFLVIEKLRELTGMGLMRGENGLDATANSDAFVEVSGILKAHASNLIKISNDLRLLNLLGEIELPALQAGSSIMAGKVNPVLLEAVIQTGLKVIANDMVITECVLRSTLQINEFMPLLAHSILESLDLLANINALFSSCVLNINANKEKCSGYFDKSNTLITAFLPHIGYDKANQLLQEFNKSGKINLREFLNDKLGKDLTERVLSPYNLNSLGFKDNGKNT